MCWVDELFNYKFNIMVEEEREAWEATAPVLKFNWRNFLAEPAYSSLFRRSL